MNREILREFFEKYIKGTPEKAIVADRKMQLCRMTIAVSNGIGIEDHMRGIYITSRCLKHLYDKKPAEEFLFLVEHLHEIARYPDRVYRNKTSKRGEFCLIKKIGGHDYLCSIEIIESSFGLETTQPGDLKKEIQTATAFRLRDDNYTKNYTLLWDWGNGNPHRSALDTP